MAVVSEQREEKKREEEGREGEAFGVTMEPEGIALTLGGRSRGIWNLGYGQFFEKLCNR